MTAYEMGGLATKQMFQEALMNINKLKIPTIGKKCKKVRFFWNNSQQSRVTM